MSTDSDAARSQPWPDTVSKAASELNNLLQIIAGASAMLEESGSESEPYRAMLRESIERAEKVAAVLAEQAGGTSQESANAAELAPFLRSKKGKSSGGAKPRILLVDDEQMTLTLVTRILKDAGFEVSTALSGFECLDLFRRQPMSFSLILLDLTMPFMDGEETFTRLKEIRPEIPVILCTGFIQQERLDRLMTSGLAGFLRKPVAPDEIVAMVRSALASVRYASGVDPNAVPLAM